jgi:type VI secretion system secreted protein VgrG
MAREPLRYFIELGASRYEVKTVSGEEGLSRTSRFELTFHVADDDPLDPDALISNPATLSLERGPLPARSLALYVTEVRRGATRKIRGKAGGALIKLVLEPRLAMLRKRSDIRVFRDKTAPTIVKEVLSAMGVGVSLRLRDSYEERPYCVQFRESDFDFAARLLEDDGIFFACMDDGSVVLGDHPSSYDDRVAELPFRAGSGLDQNEDSVYGIGQRGTMTAGKVSLRDFNHEHPSLNMDVSADGPTEGGAEWYDYPGEYEVPAQGQVKAQKRADALACVHRRVIAQSFCAELRPVARFLLLDAPMGVREGGYVVTRVTHSWSRTEGGFAVEIESLSESTTFRPEVKTPVPTEPNPLTGFTTGPAGADIHTDTWGRVKVWFPWDRLQARKGDANVSHWVPILQDNTGRSSAIMRTDWEVVCQFMEGDPDRPVIVGRVFNGFEPHFTVLPENKMRTALRSQTSPRSEPGANYIQFDDKAGFESIMIGTPRDQNIVIANDKNEQTDEVDGSVIDGDEKIHVANDMKLAVKALYAPTCQGNQTVHIGGDNTVEVGNAMLENTTKDNKLTIGGNHSRKAKLSENTHVSKDHEESITGDVTEQSKGSNISGVGTDSKLLVKGSHTERCKKTKTESSGTVRKEEIGGNLVETAGKEIATRVEDKRRLRVSKDVTVKAEANLLLAGAERMRGKANHIGLSGECELTIKVGNTQIKMEGGTIQLVAEDDIEFKMSGANQLRVPKARQDFPRGAE